MAFEVERTLPERLALANANRYVVRGWAAGRARMKSVTVSVGRTVFRASEVESFRPDIMRRYAEHDPRYLYLISGWSVPIVLCPVPQPQELAVSLTIVFRDGGTLVRSLGKILVEPSSPARRDVVLPPGVTGQNLLVVCMATYNPDLARFRRQVESIRGQDFTNWICLVSDDASEPGARAGMRDVLSGDPRFQFIEHGEQVGFYHNFERCLQLVPAQASWVALADQDDLWYPHKLSTCLARLTGPTQLVYCDMRIVSASGRVHSATYWTKRTNHYRSQDIDLLAVANTVTGAACVFRRGLLDLALPFPPRYGNVFHDHWLAVLAAASGGIRYVDEPLYDYLQTPEGVIGHYASLRRTLKDFTQSVGARSKSPWKAPSRFVASAVGRTIEVMKMFYLFREGAGEGIWTVLETARLRVGPSRACKKAGRALRLWGILGLRWKIRRRGARLARVEDFLLLSHAARLGYRVFLAVPFGPALWIRPARYVVKNVVKMRGRDPGLCGFRRKFSGRCFEVTPGRKPCVNVVTSTLEAHLLFAGYLTVLNMAKRLSDLGHTVRILLTDQIVLSPKARSKLCSHDERLRDFLSRVELVPCFDLGHRIPITPHDVFVATSWWTAYLAAEAVAKTVYSKFIFLEQDYEPIFYANSAWRVLAEGCYRLNFFPIFSTEILRRYFLESGLIAPENAGESFSNPVLAFSAPDGFELETRRPRRLVFYARPGEHHARNLYPIGLAALDLAAEQGGFRAGEWEVLAVGGDVGLQILPGGLCVRHLGVLTVQKYAELLAGSDLGLALMYSPHPGLLPIEMASAGMLVVTNTYGIKDQAYFHSISRNITAVETSPQALAEALLAASKRVGDAEARILGSRVNWPHDWKEALSDELLERALGAVRQSCAEAQVVAHPNHSGPHGTEWAG